MGLSSSVARTDFDPLPALPNVSFLIVLFTGSSFFAVILGALEETQNVVPNVLRFFVDEASEKDEVLSRNEPSLIANELLLRTPHI